MADVLIVDDDPGVLALLEVLSGGSEPASEVNPAAVEAMREKGIDITRQYPKPWTDETVGAADVVVTMGCGDVCPVLPGKRYLDWELEDPAGKGVDDVRPVRDEIEQRVRGLMAELGVEPRADRVAHGPCWCRLRVAAVDWPDTSTGWSAWPMS